ncbi:hypothetical protein [Mycolicibacterium chlorophenolicum]|uniref:Uncharacterized protein n=1 Tax=Mycolicibacterium chlorophenolicum TaxID=37916 RepID=A0A0J6YA75_9MYCO|nr:hypothetical protein [Mycolicibacterium chlorophenolicum]KMO69836.1 hypothetical protein MCHLDSM_05948 [Mycolicibacterium chlorophenolicum]
MTTTTAQPNIAFALVRDAEALMDAVDPGATLLADHDYGPITIRARRVYTPTQDTLTLIAYHEHQLVATIIASNNGHRVTARIHQIFVAGVLFKRHGDWGFVGIGRVDGRRRRFGLTANRNHGWRVDVNGEEPTLWSSLDDAATHITTTYAPAT